MGRFKSKTGCLTCLARKKKCDEGLPTCQQCHRLKLTCVLRDNRNQDNSAALVTSTNLRAPSTALHPALSSFPRFESELEKEFTSKSPIILRGLVSPLAAATFRGDMLFGRFSTQSRLVRDAIVAFASYGQGSGDADKYKQSLKSYQGCITRLKQPQTLAAQDDTDKDYMITAICFLGLLEGLKLGDPSNTIAHFEACQRLLVSRLARLSETQDADLLNLYRMVAECIIFNLASLSCYDTRVGENAAYWNTSYDQIFPPDERHLSPFLGGFQAVYGIMFQINTLLRRPQQSPTTPKSLQTIRETCARLWRQLDDLEGEIPHMYPNNQPQHQTSTPKMATLYKSKHQITIHALRIHLLKLQRPSASPPDLDIHYYTSQALKILHTQSIHEPGNPALRWPLTILACAVEDATEFDFIGTKMREMAEILDPANCQRLRRAWGNLKLWRERTTREREEEKNKNNSCGESQMDFLLEPWKLDLQVLEN